MITGIHALLYSKDADATRALFRDVLGFSAVDAGHGWLIFALPPAELGIHPEEQRGEARTELYLMCDNLESTVAELRNKGVELARAVSDQGWGRVSAIRLPGGGELGLYEPRHPTALALAIEQAIEKAPKS
jgi:catechol 2,3-dioxygenase-like lactoylglutathione lyase family enzyme